MLQGTLNCITWFNKEYTAEKLLGTENRRVIKTTWGLSGELIYVGKYVHQLHFVYKILV